MSLASDLRAVQSLTLHDLVAELPSYHEQLKALTKGAASSKLLQQRQNNVADNNMQRSVEEEPTENLTERETFDQIYAASFSFNSACLGSSRKTAAAPAFPTVSTAVQGQMLSLSCLLAHRNSWLLRLLATLLLSAFLSCHIQFNTAATQEEAVP